MVGKYRFKVVIYTLAAALFLLALAGDGTDLLNYFWEERPERTVETAFEVTSVRTERVLMEGTEWETVLYKISSPTEGPTVMIIGGIHGNEPAGFKAADTMKNWAIDRGTLLVLPRANVPAIEARSRRAPSDGLDLNRTFPGDADGTGTEIMASVIVSLMEEFEPDWVIDLHEASNFERNVPGSLGQTLIYPRNADALDVVEKLKKAVNRTILNKDHHFLIIRGGTTGTLINEAHTSGYEAIITETVTKMPMEDRIHFQQQIVTSLLYILGITIY